ncbi:hypothetical protein BDZ94DRAFT_398971 [Collybia nuda]|uniref:Uncharacterized protein n=1 Tax=Collybia nuda TaxID=64659 RepID=A0A9P6C8U6_9AGAR|nr:hypothetical protein BDZ94DRAFT_398971 [Collybia nuda]
MLGTPRLISRSRATILPSSLEWYGTVPGHSPYGKVFSISAIACIATFPVIVFDKSDRCSLFGAK